MINTNDLIGLRRAWGALPGDSSGMIDCCLMATEVHKRLGYYDYTQDIMQYFEQYTDATFPPSIIPRWLLKNAKKLKAPCWVSPTLSMNRNKAPEIKLSGVLVVDQGGFCAG